MSSKEILWICPGNMAPNCAGKVGDVLVASAVTARFQDKGWEIHFVTNSVMSQRLANTYGISVSIIKDTENGLQLGVEDLIKALSVEHIFILRPFGDAEGNSWQNQLVKDGQIDPNKICRVGGLNAYSVNGPHLTEQILAALPPVFQTPLNKPLLPLLKLDEDIYNKKKEENRTERHYLILPFAGGREKWLPIELILGMIKASNQQNIFVEIAGTKFGQEPAGLLEIGVAVKNNSLKARCHCTTLEEIAVLGACCEKIFSVDGGICWATVAGLNWLTKNVLLQEDTYPKITVILGRDQAGNLAPTACVWKPLVKFPDHVKQVNKVQNLRLIDIANEIGSIGIIEDC